MTSTTSETSNAIKAGSVITARTSDTNRVVWFYVIAPLPDNKVFGVNVGMNAGYVSPDGAGMRFDTATVEHWGDPRPLTLARFDAPVLEALTSFLASAGIALPTGEETPATPASDAVASAVAEVERKHRAWLDSLVSDAHDWADSNSLCSEFDRFMDEHGLPGREREQSVEYTVTVTYSGTAYVNATSEEDAAEQVADDPWTYIDRDTIATYGSVDVDIL